MRGEGEKDKARGRTVRPGIGEELEGKGRDKSQTGTPDQSCQNHGAKTGGKPLAWGKAWGRDQKGAGSKKTNMGVTRPNK